MILEYASRASLSSEYDAEELDRAVASASDTEHARCQREVRSGCGIRGVSGDRQMTCTSGHRRMLAQNDAVCSRDFGADVNKVDGGSDNAAASDSAEAVGVYYVHRLLF